jgi:hypothetical protein
VPGLPRKPPYLSLLAEEQNWKASQNQQAILEPSASPNFKPVSPASLHGQFEFCHDSRAEQHNISSNMAVNETPSDTYLGRPSWLPAINAFKNRAVKWPLMQMDDCPISAHSPDSLEPTNCAR